MQIILLVVFSIIALVLLALVYGTSKKVKRISLVWRHRQEIAKVACRIEHSNAPDHTKRFVSFLADRTFDESFIKEVVVHLKSDGFSKQSKKEKFHKHMTVEFGKEYVDSVLSAVRHYVNMILILEEDSISLPVAEKKGRKTLTKGVHDTINEYVDHSKIAHC